MTAPKPPTVPDVYIQRLNGLLKTPGRKMIGLVGAPGAGKSTLAAALQAAFPANSQVVPMDGFHLANVELDRLGLRHCKGAPMTFDSVGYVALLSRIRQQLPDEVIYAPEFRREIEEPVAGAIPVFPETQLIIAEGNYLLLEEGAWQGVAPLMDEIWYVDIDDALRTDRLTSRHQQFGRSLADAQQWVKATDEPNAQLIAATRTRADLVFRW
jgi:pantothenate kinase